MGKKSRSKRTRQNANVNEGLLTVLTELAAACDQHSRDGFDGISDVYIIDGCVGERMLSGKRLRCGAHEPMGRAVRVADVALGISRVRRTGRDFFYQTSR